VQGRGVRADQGGGGSTHAVFQRLPSAVLLSDDGRDGGGDAARWDGDGDAGRQREPGGGVDRADRDGEGGALRDPRRGPHGRGGHGEGEREVIGVREETGS